MSENNDVTLVFCRISKTLPPLLIAIEHTSSTEFHDLFAQFYYVENSGTIYFFRHPYRIIVSLKNLRLKISKFIDFFINFKNIFFHAPARNFFNMINIFISVYIFYGSMSIIGVLK